MSRTCVLSLAGIAPGEIKIEIHVEQTKCSVKFHRTLDIPAAGDLSWFNPKRMPGPSVTLNNQTFASNPAATPISPLRWVCHYPTWPLIWISLLATSGFLVFRVSIWFLLLLIPVLAFNVLYWIRIKEFFKMGDANPGMIIQLDPVLIAVATDLVQHTGSYPAIKVISTRLKSFMGQPPRVGLAVPTVALYESSLDKNCPHWGDFDPRPLECATGNPEILQRVMDSFTEHHWQFLRSALPQLPKKEPGLYLLKAQPAEEEPSLRFVFAKIYDSVTPFERNAKYEDPLNQDLEARGWGKITGGGTMLSGGERAWVGLDFELTHTDGPVEFIRQRLLELGAPEGSQLEYTENGQKITVPIHQC